MPGSGTPLRARAAAHGKTAAPAERGSTPIERGSSSPAVAEVGGGDRGALEHEAGEVPAGTLRRAFWVRRRCRRSSATPPRRCSSPHTTRRAAGPGCGSIWTAKQRPTPQSRGLRRGSYCFDGQPQDLAWLSEGMASLLRHGKAYGRELPGQSTKHGATRYKRRGTHYAAARLVFKVGPSFDRRRRNAGAAHSGGSEYARRQDGPRSVRRR